MVQAPAAEALFERLKGFLEVHTKFLILKSDVSTLLLYTRASHANQKRKPEDPTILLLQCRKQALGHAPDERLSVIDDFLILEALPGMASRASHKNEHGIFEIACNKMKKFYH